MHREKFSNFLKAHLFECEIELLLFYVGFFLTPLIKSRVNQSKIKVSVSKKVSFST